MARPVYWAPVLAAAALAGCQLTTTDETPTAPSSPAPLSIPVILPTPTPAPAPTPGPNPTPEPTPTPAPSGSCGLPESNPANPVCTDESALLFGPVDEALTWVTKAYPSLFDFNDKKCDNCYYIKDPDRFFEVVVKRLGSQGVCALAGGDEIGVKNTNAFSEQFDLVLWSNHMRRGPGSYRGICRPAIF
jgi:hypothetical protein